MARCAAKMRFGQNSSAPDRQHAFSPEAFCNRVSDDGLRAIQLHRWQESAVWQLSQAQRLSADSDEIFHVVVPGRNVCVANRPIDSDAFANVRFEIQVAPSINLAAPHYRTPAHLAAANPSERLAGFSRVGMLFIVYEELRRPFITRVTSALNGLIFLQAAAIAHSPEFHHPRRNVLDIVFRRQNWTPGLEHKGSQSFLGELFRDRALDDNASR